MKKTLALSTHIFVLHYEKIDVTLKCLDALIADPAFGIDFKVIVIDNGSGEATVPWEETVGLVENFPLIRAFNLGMQAYPAENYVCLTNDTIPAVGMVGKLVDALNDPQVGIVAPGTNDMGSGILFVGDQPIPDFESVETSHVDNVCWAFRHDFVEQVGWPDCEGHTHRACWSSNQDYCYRARQAGYKVLAVRGAYLWHAHMGGSDSEAWRAGRDWLERKWGDEARFVWA